jgi:CRISPR/Cas system-associated protein Cas7 (RAMP superfamily)
VRATLNDLAFDTRTKAQENIRDSFILRNKFTERRVVVEKARQFKISQMEARTGHTHNYMKTQEQSGTIHATKKYKTIPTRVARIGSNVRKSVRSKYRLRNVNTDGQFFVGTPRGRRGLYARVGRSKIIMIHDLRFTKVFIRKRPWLEPAMRRAANPQRVEGVFFKNAERARKKFKS